MGKIHEFIPVIYPFRLWVGMNRLSAWIPGVKEPFLLCAPSFGRRMPAYKSSMRRRDIGFL